MFGYYIPELIDVNLKTNIVNIEPLMFRRQFKKLQEYEEHIKTIDDLTKHIIETFFEKKLYFINQIDEDTILSYNSFEYSKPPDMSQYIIWTKNNDMTHDDVLEHLEEFIDEKEYILWTNKGTVHTSVPQIKHFHLMLRDKKGTYDLDKLIILMNKGESEDEYKKGKFFRQIYGKYDIIKNLDKNQTLVSSTFNNHFTLGFNIPCDLMEHKSSYPSPDYLDDLINELLLDSKLKMAYISVLTDDLFALAKYYLTDIVKFPDSGDNLRFELWKMKDEETKVLRIYYNDVIIKTLFL